MTNTTRKQVPVEGANEEWRVIARQGGYLIFVPLQQDQTLQRHTCPLVALTVVLYYEQA